MKKNAKLNTVIAAVLLVAAIIPNVSLASSSTIADLLVRIENLELELEVASTTASTTVSTSTVTVIIDEYTATKCMMNWKYIPGTLKIRNECLSLWK